MTGVPAYVAVLLVHLHFPANGSLKGKRKELAPVRAHLQGKLGAAVAEVDHHDLWQRGTLAAVFVAGSQTHASDMADTAERWLIDRFPDGVRVDRTLVSLEDLAA